MKTNILSNWNFSRIVRLIIGAVIVFEAVNSGDPLIGLGGLFFIGMALFNVGCCGACGCYIPLKKTAVVSEDISYEEIK